MPLFSEQGIEYACCNCRTYNACHIGPHGMHEKVVGPDLPSGLQSGKPSAAIGTAETPAEPIRGLTFPPERKHISFPSSKPPLYEHKGC